ncbi:MAG TPA: VOC family protein, partial [Acidimicrobiales bacterium]
LGASPVAGMIEMTDQWPAGLPPHWMVYFTVDDCDRTTARLQQLGGGVTVPPTDIEPGRFAVVHDPQGNTFSVIAPRHAR